MPDLCTLGYVKGLLGSDVANITTNDSVYTALISAASQLFVTLTNRSGILAQQFTETRNGDNSTSLILRNTPVISISALSVAPSSISGQPTGIPLTAFTGSGPGYVLGDDGFSVELVGSLFYRGTRNVSITYTAGFTTVPLDIQQAVAEMVLWKKAKMPRIDTNSHSLAPGETISFSSADIPPSARSVVKQYTQYGGFRTR